MYLDVLAYRRLSRRARAMGLNIYMYGVLVSYLQQPYFPER